MFAARMQDVFVDEWDSTGPILLAHGFAMGEGWGDSRFDKRARRVSAIKSRQPSGPYLRHFSKGWHPVSIVYRKNPPAAVRDRPSSDSSPNRANKRPQRTVERQRNCDISIHTCIYAHVYPPGGQFAFIFKMVIRKQAIIIIAILERPCSLPQ